jgi:zinc protease
MPRLVVLLALALFPAAVTCAGAAGRLEANGFSFVRAAGGIAEYRLDANRLTVLLMEDHSTPVLTFMVTYLVGSRNEVTGTTGAAHLLEHLMFKGSRNFHAGIGRGYDTMMDRVGGINNATTWLDRTNYYANLPSDHLELAIQLEADRMRNLLLREEDRRTEMTVVRNEFELGENDPVESLRKEIGAAAYLAHPYHHPTIGWRSDIEKVSIERLREFYDTFYWPNNATVTVIGDFHAPTALRLIHQYFGAIPVSPRPVPQVYTEEPPQTGPRRVTVRRPGEIGVVEIAYKATAALHPDHAPLDVLATILSEGKTSRLYRDLIHANLAIGAYASKGFFRDPSLFTVTAMLAPGVAHAEAEKTLLAAIERVQQEGVSPAEVEGAINQIVAAIAYARDGSFAIAGQMNEFISVGDWTYYLTVLDRVKAVTAADVQRVARTYCVEEQSTTGWFVPQIEAEEGLGRDEAPGAPGIRPPAPHYYRVPATAVPAGRPQTIARSAGTTPAADINRASEIAPRVRRRTVAGIDVLTLKTSIQEVVTLRGVLHAGDVFNPPGNSAIANLTAGMLDRGTLQRDKFEMAGLLEQAGATLHFRTGSHTLNVSGKCLRKDLPRVLGLLAEQLRAPRFDAAELARLKQQLSGEHRRNMEDPNFRARGAFARAAFPAQHPNRPPADETYLADIEAATLEQVKAFHAGNYGPIGFRMVLVGDINDAAIDAALAEAFDGWQGGRPLPDTPPAPPLQSARTEKVFMPGKTSVAFTIGQPSRLRYADPEYQALNLATSVLGSGFFSARLLDVVRNREGLTYGIFASLSGDTYADGSWSIQATFAPELLEAGIASTVRELKRFHSEGVTAAELATFKVTLAGSYKVALATTDGLAIALLNAVQRGYGPEWVDEFPRRLDSLTLKEVNGAIRKHLSPERMVRVISGTFTPVPGR